MPTTSQRPVDDVRLTLARLPKDTPLDVVFATACENSAHVLKISRVSIWLFIEHNSALRCVNLYEHGKDEHSGGTILRVADFPNYFQSINLQKAVPAEIALTDPRTAELADSYMKPLGIVSMLDAGIFLEGELVGVICHEQVGTTHAFSMEDRDFAGSMADLVALRIQAAELHELKAAFRTQEHRLLASEKADALAQMAAGVAHDFNNLLTIITGHASLMRELAGLPLAAETHLKPMLEACTRGQALVKELINFARPEQGGRPSVVDLTAVLRDFLPMIRSAFGTRHRLEFAKDTASALVMINKTQFCRIVLNLALNARDAMPDGGAVSIRIASVRTTGGNQSMHYILIEVRDTGTGMDPETLRKAGEPYFTTKAAGTGLGLAIVKKNVDRAGGHLRIQSHPGKGTMIQVLLPRVGFSTGDTEEFPIPEGLQAVQ